MRYRLIIECFTCKDWHYYDEGMSRVCANCGNPEMLVSRVVE